MTNPSNVELSDYERKVWSGYEVELVGSMALLVANTAFNEILELQEVRGSIAQLPPLEPIIGSELGYYYVIQNRYPEDISAESKINKLNKLIIKSERMLDKQIVKDPR